MGLSRPIEIPKGPRDKQILTLLEESIRQHREIVHHNSDFPSICCNWQQRLTALESFQATVRKHGLL